MTAPIWLFLDFDNTLMGTERFAVPTLIKRFNLLYADKIGRELTPDEFFTHFQGDARETLCRKLSDYFGIDVDYPTLFANRDWEMMQYVQNHGVCMAPNVMDTLNALCHRGFKLSIVTNNSVQRALAAMRYATNGEGENLAKLFGTNYFESGAIQKPDPDVYNRAILQVGADRARAYAVEDSVTGMRSALAAGIPAFGYVGYAEHPETRERELMELGATACFHDWAQFQSLLFDQLSQKSAAGR